MTTTSDDFARQHSPLGDGAEPQGWLQTVFDHAPVLIYVVGSDGRFIAVNDTFRMLSGLERRQLVGRSLYDVFPPDVAGSFETNNQQVLEAGVPLEFKESHEGRSYLSVKAPVRDRNSDRRAIVGMSIDITELEASQDLLRESEERFRAMTDGLPLIVWVHGPNGEQEFVNETFCEFFGVARGQLSGTFWQTLLHPEDAEAYTAKFLDCVRSRTPFHAEARVRRADGQWRWIESWARPRISTAGVFCGFVGTSADITQRKQDAELLLESEARLRQSNERKNEFIAALAHEVRNPLSAISSALDIMRLSSRRADREAARELAERQLQHLARLTNDLLEVSRINLGHLSLEKEIIDVRDVIADAIAQCHGRLHERRHVFDHARPAEAIRIYGDRTRLCQAVSNLLSNAIRYTPEGGRIALDVSRQGGDVAISVTDNGIGLRPEEMEAVFEPFLQGESARTSCNGGLGLGLSLAKSLVENHGGTINAASAGPGRGSCFTIRLPLA